MGNFQIPYVIERKIAQLFYIVLFYCTNVEQQQKIMKQHIFWKPLLEKLSLPIN